MAAKILLIYTGGTIGMVSDAATGALKPLNFREIESEIPALRRLGVDIEYHESFTPIDSSDVTPEVWARLAEVIRDNYSSFDGFVVLHGTDTMAYTASALSFMFENLAKPIVFTGSQIPIGVLRTDGRENLVTAVEIAAARNQNGAAMAPEVTIYFQNKLLRANRTVKWSAEQLNAFSSENYPALADVGVTIHYNESAIAHPTSTNPTPTNPASTDPTSTVPTSELKIATAFARNVVAVRLFPGMEPHVLEAMLGIEGLRGVVLQTYGTGNTPTAPWFLDALSRAISRGIVIANVTQCIAGGVTPFYESGMRLARAGVVSGGDMTPEAAITKLMYLLGRNLSADDVRRKMSESLRGEMSR
jgi:L-asparaginase